MLGAYVADGLRLGVEYFNATDYSAALVASPASGDGAHGVSGFASYRFAPEWSVFSRYDSVDTNTRTVPGKNDAYFTLGTSWNPVKTVELALAYKRETAKGGAVSTAAGTIGSNAGVRTGAYNEFGLWGTLQF